MFKTTYKYSLYDEAFRKVSFVPCNFVDVKSLQRVGAELKLIR